MRGLYRDIQGGDTHLRRRRWACARARQTRAGPHAATAAVVILHTVFFFASLCAVLVVPRASSSHAPHLFERLLHLLRDHDSQSASQRQDVPGDVGRRRSRGGDLPAAPTSRGKGRTSSIASRSFVSIRTICFPVCRSICSICCQVALSCTKLIEMPFRPKRPVRPARTPPCQPRPTVPVRAPRAPTARREGRRAKHSPMRWMYVSMSGRLSPRPPCTSRSFMSGRS